MSASSATPIRQRPWRSIRPTGARMRASVHGGVSSTTYALQYGETSYSSWSPYMAPVKIVMLIGIFLTFLQATSIFIKDLATAMGRPLA